MSKKGFIAIMLLLLAVALWFGFSYRSPYDAAGEIKITHAGLTFPGGAWKVVYVQDGRQHIEIFRTREEAEDAGF